MHAAVKILPHYTYEDYCNWEGRWELIDGIPYAMSPAPIPLHQLVSANLIYEFINAIKKNKCKHFKVYDFIDVKVSEDTILQPDVSIVCKQIEKKFLDFPAILVVEILSPVTAFKDRHVKFSLYEKMGIKYFLIIDIERKIIEINTLTDNQYELTTYPGSQPFLFILEDDCLIDVELNNIWE
ncbi:MAG: Uma2 family endonuclease [Ginsengibacter sp.]